jgi:hypothetical protein
MHRLAIAALPIALALAVTLVIRTPEPPTCGLGPSGEPASAIERDLVLELAVANLGPFTAANLPELRWTIRNTSPTAQYAVIQGGDGSESGWREPFFTLAAEELRPDGTWQPLARRPYGRCGVYDPEWRDEVVTLAPGESLALEWAPWAQVWFDLTKVERVRFRAEYRFTRGEAGKGMDPRGGSAPAGADPGIPAFTLRSAPLEVAFE